MAKTTSLVYEVRKPYPSVRLINIGPIESVAQQVPELRGPVMALWAWISREESRQGGRVLPHRSGPLPDSEIIVWDDDAMAMPGNATVFCERSYYVPLDRILMSSPDASHEAMRGFAQRCFEHLRRDLSAS